MHQMPRARTRASAHAPGTESTGCGRLRRRERSRERARKQTPQQRDAPDSGCEERMTWCRSVSISSYTRYASLKKPTPGGFITSCAVHSRKRLSRKPPSRVRRVRRRARLDGDDVLVLQVAQQQDLAQRALGVHGVVKNAADALDGNLLAVRIVRGAHHAVGALADGLQRRVLGVHLRPTRAGQRESRQGRAQCVGAAGGRAQRTPRTGCRIR